METTDNEDGIKRRRLNEELGTLFSASSAVSDLQVLPEARLQEQDVAASNAVTDWQILPEVGLETLQGQDEAASEAVTDLQLPAGVLCPETLAGQNKAASSSAQPERVAPVALRPPSKHVLDAVGLGDTDSDN